MRDIFNVFLLGLFCVAAAGCNRNAPPQTVPEAPVASAPVVPAQPTGEKPTKTAKAAAPAGGVPFYTYEVVKVLPHDPGAFTQGLVFLNGALFESTGLNGQSTLRKVDFETGQVLKRVDVPAEYFAEGLTVLGDKAYQLTWKNHKGFVYDLASFRLEKEFAYEGEGWGLTTDGRWLILSDGTDQIRFLDPGTFETKRSIHVRFQGSPVGQLNELEYVNGEIFANIWRADYVVRINPEDGSVAGVIDFSGLLGAPDRGLDTDVLNGIAYDAAGQRLFVTGKKWPKLFEVRLKPRG